MPEFSRAEVEAAHDAYVATRDRIEAGELPWDALAEFFTEDAIFIDPAWGRMDGKAAIAKFMRDSMAGLDDWTFPHLWRTIDGRRVVAAWWNRLPGTRADGTFFEALGVSIMEYAGGGKFAREEDLLNMVHVFELMKESGWKPSADVNAPPAGVRRA